MGKTVLNVFYCCYELSGWLSFVLAGLTVLLSKTLLRRSKNNNISGKREVQPSLSFMKKLNKIKDVPLHFSPTNICKKVESDYLLALAVLQHF